MPKSKKKKNNPIGPILLIASGIIVILAIVVWQLTSGAQAAESGANSTAQTTSGVLRVSLNEARTAFEDGSALFLDVRDADSFAAGHIPGAINIPLNQLESRLDELDANRWIITYCT